MKEPKFAKKDFVTYEDINDKNGTCTIGIIEQVMCGKQLKRRHLRQDGVFGDPTGELYEGDVIIYKVNFSTEGSFLVDEDDLQEVVFNMDWEKNS